MQVSQPLIILRRFKRPHIVLAFVINRHTTTGYPKPLLGTTVRIYIKIQEQIGIKACAPLEAPVPPSSHAERAALKLAAAR
jgi:hypothetical protein